MSENLVKVNPEIVALTEECKRLWALLDDISTAGDVFKPEITPYFKYVNGTCDNRDGLFYSDGYEILRVKKENKTPVDSEDQQDSVI